LASARLAPRNGFLSTAVAEVEASAIIAGRVPSAGGRVVAVVGVCVQRLLGCHDGFDVKSWRCGAGQPQDLGGEILRW
jgi:hypothetical protein